MKECKLREIDEVLCELYESDIPNAEIVLEEDDFRIIAEDLRIVFPDLGLEAREGVAEAVYDGVFMPDFSVTLIYDMGADIGDYLYWEQDGIEVSMHNFLTMTNRLPDDLGDVKCQIEYMP